MFRISLGNIYAAMTKLYRKEKQDGLNKFPPDCKRKNGLKISKLSGRAALYGTIHSQAPCILKIFEESVENLQSSEFIS